METIRRPRKGTRRAFVSVEWLQSLDTPQIISRWPISGEHGFYQHERDWLADHNDSPEVARLVALYRDRLAQQGQRAEERSEQQRLEAEARREYVKASIDGHEVEHPHSVKEAAMRASQLYMNGSVPRELKQCIAIAAAEYQVAWSAIERYLAGVGVRVLWAKLAPEDIWYPEDAELGPSA